jgi:putative peptidoglycan lipid II flippase
MQDTRTPVKVAAVALAANILLSIVLMKPLKHSGLALANALSSGINFTLLFFFLSRRLGKLDVRGIFLSFLKIIFASSVMGVTGWFILQGSLWQTYGNTPQKAFYLSGTIIICITIYVVRQKFRG